MNGEIMGDARLNKFRCGQAFDKNCVDCDYLQFKSVQYMCTLNSLSLGISLLQIGKLVCDGFKTKENNND
jgi:hypothetical protein